MNNEGRVKKTRGIRKPVSCTECRRRKLKCNKDLPCNSCVKRGIPDVCVYNRELPNRGNLLNPHQQPNGSGSNVKTEPNANSVHPLLSQQPPSSVPTTARPLAGPTTASDNVTLLRELLKGTSDPQQQRDLNAVLTSLVSANGGGGDGYGRNGPQTLKSNMRTNGDGSSKYEATSLRWDSLMGKMGHEFTGIASSHEDQSQHNALSSGFPFCDTPVQPSRQELLSLLPERSVCDYLLERYIQVFSSLFHILHEPTLRRDYEQLFSESRTSLSLAFFALIYTILGLSLNSLEDNDPYIATYLQSYNIQRLEDMSQIFLNQAKKCLVADNFMIHHSLTTLQALILLCYALSHSQGSSGASWPLLGMTINIAVSLGCHVDGSHLDISFYEAEQRRRSWAALLLMDMLQTCSFGRPSMLNAASFDTRFPHNFNDSDLTAYAKQGSNKKQNLAIADDRNTRLTQMSYMNFKFRFYELTSALFPRMLDTHTVSYQQVQELDAKIVEQRKTWDSIYLSTTKSNALFYHFVQYDILHIYLNQIYLLLHRPHYYAEPFSRQRCINAAYEIISRFQNFCYDERYKPFKWYARGLGGFYCFHAAIVLAIVVIENQQQGNNTGSPIPSQEQQDAFAKFEAALNLLLGLASRSNIAKKTTDVLLQVHQKLSEVYSPSLSTASSTYSEGSVTSDVDLQLDQFVIEPVITDIAAWTGPKSFDWMEWDSILSNTVHP